MLTEEQKELFALRVSEYIGVNIPPEYIIKTRETIFSLQERVENPTDILVMEQGTAPLLYVFKNRINDGKQGTMFVMDFGDIRALCFYEE